MPDVAKAAEAVRVLLLEGGADLVGFADLRPVEGARYPYGVSFAFRLPAEIVETMREAPSPAYLEAWHYYYDLADRLATQGAETLTAAGWPSRPQSRAYAKRDGEERPLSPELPHKTVATRGGLGWIGRCALLVTPEYGSAVRLGSLLTQAPLPCAQPVTASKCGECTACVQACPPGAVKGPTWAGPETEREEIYDMTACRRYAGERTRACLDSDKILCGKCIEVCPFTRSYLKAAKG